MHQRCQDSLKQVIFVAPATTDLIPGISVTSPSQRSKLDKKIDPKNIPSSVTVLELGKGEESGARMSDFVIKARWLSLIWICLAVLQHQFANGELCDESLGE